jgi:hypothetical protein
MKLSGACRSRPGGKISAQGCLDPETRAIKPIVDDLNWLSPFATSVVTLLNSFFWRLLFCRTQGRAGVAPGSDAGSSAHPHDLRFWPKAGSKSGPEMHEPAQLAQQNLDLRRQRVGAMAWRWERDGA